MVKKGVKLSLIKIPPEYMKTFLYSTWKTTFGIQSRSTSSNVKEFEELISEQEISVSIKLYFIYELVDGLLL